jgi:hypothetical protein
MKLRNQPHDQKWEREERKHLSDYRLGAKSVPPGKITDIHLVKEFSIAFTKAATGSCTETDELSTH